MSEFPPPSGYNAQYDDRYYSYAPRQTQPMPSESCAPLASSSRSENVASTLSNSRKRSAPSAAPGATSNKHARHSHAIPNNKNTDPAQSIPPAPTPVPSRLVAGIGPFDNPVGTTSRQHPAFTSFKSIIPKVQKSSSAASDVWYFMKAATSKERPVENAHPPATTTASKTLFCTRPKETIAKFLACQLCTGREWHVWSNTQGQTENMQHHLCQAHWELYRELVLAEKLKG
ncbi:hypothetical protein B0H34DRAFT_822144 [Crassisporium funariophilum]|nr:hypothetical protein B0H34DRAFT_822144 [Crassisporium funariophilum]